MFYYFYSGWKRSLQQTLLTSWKVHWHITHACIHTVLIQMFSCSREGSEGSVGWLRPGTHPVSPRWHYQAKPGHPVPDTRHLRPLPFNMWCLRVAERQGAGCKQACCQELPWSLSTVWAVGTKVSDWSELNWRYEASTLMQHGVIWQKGWIRLNICSKTLWHACCISQQIHACKHSYYYFFQGVVLQ